MPLIDVTHDGSLTETVLRRLAEVLPDIVAEGVACSEEPWSGPPAPGDVEIRFRSKGPFDVGTLNCVIEVRTKFFEVGFVTSMSAPPESAIEWLPQRPALAYSASG